MIAVHHKTVMYVLVFLLICIGVDGVVNIIIVIFYHVMIKMYKYV